MLLRAERNKEKHREQVFNKDWRWIHKIHWEINSWCQFISFLPIFAKLSWQ